MDDLMWAIWEDWAGGGCDRDEGEARGESRRGWVGVLLVVIRHEGCEKWI